MSDDDLLTGEKLTFTLDKLRKTLQDLTVRIDTSGVRRTAGLHEWKGRDCAYYWKSLDLFLKLDYKDLRDLVLEAAELFKQCEAENDR